MFSKNQKPGLEQRVLQFIQQNRLITGGQKILVAVSGGPDSVCLLYTLYRLQTELNISLHVAHLNHQLRGADSEADACYVADLARQLDIPATIEKRDVAGFQAEHRLSPEEAAREVRYRFLSQTAQAVGAAKVAVGHTRNDHVETILLHIIRGTGMRGLRGLQPCLTLRFADNTLMVVRPLLETERKETEDYCARLQIIPCLDVSNQTLSFLRNRVRRELLPLLKNYNPGIFESLLRIGRIAQDELALLDAESEKIWRELIRKKGNTVIFNKAQFLALPSALQRHLLRKGIEELLGTLKDIEARHIEEVIQALDKPAGKQIILPDGLVFSIEYDCYLMGSDLVEQIPFPELKKEYGITIPGSIEIPGWRIEAVVQPPDALPPAGERPGYARENRFTACFDLDKTGTMITMRARRQGDRFQPQGMSQTKKVSEFMLDARIPKAWRDRIPIICSPQGIIWVAGWRISENVKITAGTRQVLCLSLFRE